MLRRLRVIDAEVLEAKRQLRVRTARLRRRIDRRLAILRHEPARLTSWQTYVRRFPLGALAAALGLGLMASAGRSPRRAPRWLGTTLLSLATSAVRKGVWRDVMKLWESVQASRAQAGSDKSNTTEP